MLDNNFELTKDFSKHTQAEILNVEKGPKLILDDNKEIIAVVLHPDTFASMCDQIQDAKLLALAVKRLTGVEDPAKLSLEEFLKTCELDDEFLNKECKEDQEELEHDPLFDD